MPDLPVPSPPVGDLLFVVLHHTGVEPPHYDLLIDEDPASPLLTWRLPCWPIVSPVPATPLPPHRRHYLTYEGPISGDRGQVTRVAAGACTRHPSTDVPPPAADPALAAPRSSGFRLLAGIPVDVLLVPGSPDGLWEAIPKA